MADERAATATRTFWFCVLAVLRTGPVGWLATGVLAAADALVVANAADGAAPSAAVRPIAIMGFREN
jgi:hypothetical protein